MKTTLRYLVLILLIPIGVKAQRIVGLNQKMFAVKDTIMLDSLSLLQGSVSILGIDTSLYKVDAISSELTWEVKPKTDSILVTFRTLSLDFDYQFKHKDFKQIELSGIGEKDPFKYSGSNRQELNYLSSGLNKNGSISRGVSFGNNQDLSVNSNLNLQLSGKVSDRISVLAAITDDNIPIQAEGNTQQLQEFDKVYMQLFDDNSRLTAGDFQLKNTTPYFLKYYKKAQGGRIQTTIKSNSNKDAAGLMDVSVSGAVSRGKFSRNVIQGVEGNQGPYRLTGENNEPFIIVLSGTERVYIDGKQMTRGQEYDYTINYNTAELTFTARQLITKDKRIVIEFQYSDKNYARSLFQFSDYYQSERLNLRFDIYSEQDAKNQSLQQDLTDIQKDKLTEVGDSIHLAVASSIALVEFSENQILYKKIDTLGQEVYVFSINPDSAIYRLSFSNVGIGFGGYEQQQTTANGRVFKWVGSGKGSYEPVTLLVAPKKKQMVSLGGDYQISENTVAKFETALSSQDISTFSKLDAQDNTGYAFNLGLQNTKKIGKNEEKNYRLNSAITYEQVHQDFNEIERFRTVEFFRDWNLRNITLNEMQHISGANIEFEAANKLSLKYTLKSYVSGSEYNAIKNNFHIKYNNRGFRVDSKNSLMTSTGIHNSTYLRSKGVISKSTPWLTVGLRNDFEKNQFFNEPRDSLLANSYEFFEWEAFIANADSSVNTFRLGYTERENFGVKNNGLNTSTFGKSISFDVALIENKKATLTNKTTYRILEIRDSTLTSNKADSTLLNRIEYSVKLWKGAVVSNSFFEIGSGLEVKKEYTFLKVADGQGVWIHRDNNDNGIAELDEFEITPKSLQYQANYIKVFVPSNNYVKTFNNQFSQTLLLRPKAIWGSEKKGMKKFISRFSNQLSYLVDRKTNKDNILTALNPFEREIADSILVSQNSSFRNVFNFNRSNPKFGAGVNYYYVKNKTLLTNGFEQRTNEYSSASIRWNLNRKFRLNLDGQMGNKENLSDYLITRNFDIDYYSFQPKITFQPGTVFRIALLYEHKNKQNNSENNEQAIYHKGGLEGKFSTAEKGNVSANFNFILIDYDYPANSSLSFEMLEGLQPGQNMTWEVIYQRTLANNLQLNLNYNGRWSEGSKLVHVGGVQVRAFF
ncbi:MAG: hypothetical protein JKY53_03355 [Flavobacteriales bacterium]|nr:hypothetical protein [Flavobacteriales bacterium]